MKEDSKKHITPTDANNVLAVRASPFFRSTQIK